VRSQGTSWCYLGVSMSWCCFRLLRHVVNQRDRSHGGLATLEVGPCRVALALPFAGEANVIMNGIGLRRLAVTELTLRAERAPTTTPDPRNFDAPCGMRPLAPG
jgi:hypothetical protein